VRLKELYEFLFSRYDIAYDTCMSSTKDYIENSRNSEFTVLPLAALAADLCDSSPTWT